MNETKRMWLRKILTFVMTILLILQITVPTFAAKDVTQPSRIQTSTENEEYGNEDPVVITEDAVSDNNKSPLFAENAKIRTDEETKSMREYSLQKEDELAYLVKSADEITLEDSSKVKIDGVSVMDLFKIDKENNEQTRIEIAKTDWLEKEQIEQLRLYVFVDNDWKETDFEVNEDNKMTFATSEVYFALTKDIEEDAEPTAKALSEEAEPAEWSDSTTEAGSDDQTDADTIIDAGGTQSNAREVNEDIQSNEEKQSDQPDTIDSHESPTGSSDTDMQVDTGASLNSEEESAAQTVKNENSDNEKAEDDSDQAQKPQNIVKKLAAPLLGAKATYIVSNEIEESDGEVVWVSHTPNITDEGVKTGSYAHSQNSTSVIEIPGAERLAITIEYGGESTSYDWVCMWAGSHPSNNPYNNYSSSLTGKLGGTHGTRSYEVEGNAVTFGFRTDGSGVGDGYGYYAVITPIYGADSSEIPAYHLEDNGDGTYTLVFDQGGDISSFVNSQDVIDDIGDKFDKISNIKLHRGTTSIGRNAFENLTALENITFAKSGSLTTIKNDAFKGCENLTEVTIPKTVTTLGSAFNGCSSLETVSFEPNSRLKKISKKVFAGLTALETFNAPDQLEEIGDSAFEGCANLKNINLPDTTTKIGNGSFKACKGLEDLEWLNNVSEIGNNAFENCTGLSTITIPNTVESLGDYAFKGCTNLSSVEFEEGGNMTTLPTGLFSGCSKLKNVKLPDGLTEIPAYFFQNCTSLSRVDMPDTVTKIGDYAFSGCSKLEDMEFSENLTTIGNYAFQNCTSFQNIRIPNTLTNLGSYAFYGCNKMESFIFEDGCPLTSLPSGMFHSCSRLKNVKLPDGLKSIPSYLFYNCISLSHVDVPDGVTSIGNNAFYGCKALKEFEIGDKIKTIGSYAFAYSGLESMHIPKTVTSIGDSAFRDCLSLTSLTFDSDSPIKTTPSYLASNCTALTEVILPDGLTTIGTSSFYGCTALEDLDIPPNVTTINGSAFYNCSKLKELTINDKLKTIGSSAFYNCDKITELVIPDNVTSISSSAFQACDGLTSVVFEGESTKAYTIGSSAFYQCGALQEVVLRDGITTIDSSTFYRCDSLEEIHIPGTVTTIGTNAFYQCASLENVYFDESEKNLSISGTAFSNLFSGDEIHVDRNITSMTSTTFNNLNENASFYFGENIDIVNNQMISKFINGTDVHFAGPNDFSTQNGTNTSPDVKWKNFSGNYHVDEQGVVYKLNDDNTAYVFHVPSGVTTVTIPETISNQAGRQYEVTMIQPYAVRDASDLTGITFEAPENIKVPQHAFYGCDTLTTVNGKDKIYPEEDGWKEVSMLCDFPVAGQEPEQKQNLSATISLTDDSYTEGDPTFHFEVNVTPGTLGLDGDTYEYLTGQTSTTTISISNQSNLDMADQIVRIYFAFDGENYTLGNYAPGNTYTLVNDTNGHRYPLKVVQTDIPGVYYYDVSGFKPGDTLSFRNGFSYQSPTSGGGTMKIWCETMTSAEAEAIADIAPDPKEYILSEWKSHPTEYTTTKALANTGTAFVFASDGTENGDIYVKNLGYRIDQRSNGDTSTTEGKDYIKYVTYKDTIQLNENMIWDEKVINAVKQGRYRYTTGTNTPYIYVQIDGKEINIGRVQVGNYNYLRNVWLEVSEDDLGREQVDICWSYRNSYWTGQTNAYPTADYAAQTFYVYLEPNAVKIDRESDLWKALHGDIEVTNEELHDMSMIGNTVDETRKYSFSEDRTSEATAPEKLISVPVGFNMTKTYSSSSYFGRPYTFRINLENTGLVARDDIDHVEDTLHAYYYIKPENIDYMFKNAPNGSAFDLVINYATLCDQPEKSVLDINGTVITGFVPQEMGTEPIPYSGCASVDNSVISTNAKIHIYWNENRTGYKIDVDTESDGTIDRSMEVGEDKEFTSIKEALDDAGYVITSAASYKVRWDMPEGFKLYGGQKTSFYIPSNFKDTTMLLPTDRLHAYQNNSMYTAANTAYTYDDTNTQIASANCSRTSITPELRLNKSVSVNGETVDASNVRIPDGTVVSYGLSFSNYGETYSVLPLTDKMTGSQIMMVPLRGNANAEYYAPGDETGVLLSEAGLEVITDEGMSYYLLTKPGDYKGIKIEGKLADTISVTKAGGTLTTQMVWYYQDVTGYFNSSGSSYAISYKALVDPYKTGADYAGGDGGAVLSHGISNESWLGGHQTHRLYAAVGGESETMSFVKYISQNKDTNEKLLTHSLIRDGEEVLYKIIVKNNSESAVSMRGSQIYDSLPTTSNTFAWSKDNVTEIFYETDGSSCTTTDDSYWYISPINPATNANTASAGNYYIRWNNDFQIDFEPEGEFYIYVRCQYPSSEDGDEWDNYITKNNGSTLYNTVYINSRSSTVTHELTDVVEGYLQKGVVDVGIASDNSKFTSSGTRYYYENGPESDVGRIYSDVTYYTVVYNSGNVRLYLDTLQDQLPKGFEFRGMVNYITAEEKTNVTSSTYSNSLSKSVGFYSSGYNTIYTESGSGNESNRVATVTDPDRPTIAYKDANITATTATDEDGHQQIRFALGNGYTSGAAKNIKYDSTLNKYYLNPGEALRFAYNVRVKGYYNTENLATNTISMPVYDKYGLGVTTSEGVDVQVAQMREMTDNDGGCDIISTPQAVEQYNHTKQGTVKNTTEWYSSNVSLMRQVAIPGIKKSVGGITSVPISSPITSTTIAGSKYSDAALYGQKYDSTASINDVVNWKLRIFNESSTGANSMEDYMIVDKMDVPYQFTGQVFYNLYSNTGVRMTGTSIPLFSLGGRSENDTSVNLYEATNTTNPKTLTVNGDPVSFGSGSGTVQLLRDHDGTETLKIHMRDNKYIIPNGCYMDMAIHTMHTSSDSALSHSYYNDVILEPNQAYDPAMVSQGKVIYDVDTNPIGIESGASITITAGYATSAKKQVTEIAAPSNTGWSDRDKNAIELPRKDSTFRYDLYIDLPVDDPTQELLIIDSLPEENDHSPFVDRDMRESEFKVKLLSEALGFNVATITSAGAGTTTNLNYSQYKFEVNTKTEFVQADWNGNGTGWAEIDLSDGISAEEEALLEAARSFRVTITDSSLQTMKKNTQVKITFNAELADPANTNPGTTAWNSFGYRYTVPLGSGGGSGVSLTAEPLKVGVSIPGVPYIKKELRAPSDKLKNAKFDSDFSFVIYDGTQIPALNDISGMTEEEIYNTLVANGRSALYVPLTVEEGSSTVSSGYLADKYKWIYDSTEGEWVETGDIWDWRANGKYTILELPIKDDEEYSFGSLSRSPMNNYSFTQNTANNVLITAINHHAKTGKLKISKTVNGTNPDPNLAFTFTIHLEDRGTPVYGSFAYTGTNIADGSLLFNSDGNATIKLTGGQSIEFQEIPEGYDYTVTEAEHDWYDMSCSDNEGTIEYNTTKEAAFTNTRASSTLSLTKTVRGNIGSKYKKFAFTISATDNGRPITGEKAVTISHFKTEDTSSTITFNESGVATIELSHGETATIQNMPVGSVYEITEAEYEDEGYQLIDFTGDEGTITRTAAEAEFINGRAVAVPTGIILVRTLIHVIIVISAGCATALLLRKRYRQKTI